MACKAWVGWMDEWMDEVRINCSVQKKKTTEQTGREVVEGKERGRMHLRVTQSHTPEQGRNPNLQCLAQPLAILAGELDVGEH